MTDSRAADRTFALTAVVLIAMGIVLRLAGYFGGLEFWWDEALWAIRFAQGEPTTIRPPGYAWVSRWLIELRNTEPVLRSVSLLAGCLSLPVFLALCRRAGLSRLTSLFGLFILAAHPAAIDLTKEFKPYALELLLHLLLLWLAFSYLRTDRTSWLGATLLVAGLGPLFSWSIVMLYPGLFVALAVHAFRRGQLPRLWATLGAGALTAGMCLVAYWLQLGTRRPNHVYWGDKYDIFYVGPDSWGRMQWLLEKTGEVASFPGRLETFWLDPSVAGVLGAVPVALCLAGAIVILGGRQWDRAALWVSPWLVTIALNMLGRWPYGVFRTNLFLLGYSLLLSLAGLDGLQRWLASARRPAVGWGGRLVVPAFCGAFVLVFLPLDLSLFAETKSSPMGSTCHVHRAMRVIYEAESREAAPSRRRRFVVDSHARRAFVYYRDHHAVAREKYGDFFRERYQPSKHSQPLPVTLKRQFKRGFWLLACHPEEAAAIRSYALGVCPEVEHLEDFRDGSLLVGCRGIGEPASVGNLAGPEGRAPEGR